MSGRFLLRGVQSPRQSAAMLIGSAAENEF
jgi:hypothetical protein